MPDLNMRDVSSSEDSGESEVEMGEVDDMKSSGSKNSPKKARGNRQQQAQPQRKYADIDSSHSDSSSGQEIAAVKSQSRHSSLSKKRKLNHVPTPATRKGSARNKHQVSSSDSDSDCSSEIPLTQNLTPSPKKKNSKVTSPAKSSGNQLSVSFSVSSDDNDMETTIQSAVAMAMPGPGSTASETEVGGVTKGRRSMRRRAKVPLRYPAPPGFQGASVGDSDSGVRLEDVETGDQEIWLLKIPANFDVSELHKATAIIGGATHLKTHKGPAQDFAKGTEERVMSSWEVEGRAWQDGQPQSSSWSVLLPSKDHGDPLPAGPVCGLMEVKRSLHVEPYERPEVVTRRVLMPQGLKMRNVPFGADDPLVSCGYREMKKRKRKHRQSTDVTDSLLIKQEEVPDVTPKKKKKKKKDHKHGH